MTALLLDGRPIARDMLAEAKAALAMLQDWDTRTMKVVAVER